ncbi:hypothetical protein ACF053_28010 [Streptomyces kanasensis]|uniref:hypothetical protein n=1 Tax=Streptomyces kanasensis TaxID=936756 RepID=UPI0036F4BB64
MDTLLISTVSVLLTLLVTAVFHPLASRLSTVSRRITRIKPLTVHVETDPSLVWAGFPNWVPAFVWLPDPPTGTPPEHPTDWYAWARARGGADAAQTVLKVTVTARELASVVIECPKLRHEFEPLDDPPAGCVACCPTGGAAVTPRRIQVDLGLGTTTWVDDGGSPIGPVTLTLSPGETEQFLVFVHAHSGRNEWHLELPVLVDGKRQMIPLRDKGERFVTYGPEGFDEYRWSDGGWERHHQGLSC